ncbi:hypothetical protein ALO78_200060 [Pseudomonas amygdali pv. ciccaronei]|nr:hypothetical protein ALO78_200060 [Pseudomonas amygdali pv. ciccaronei]
MHHGETPGVIGAEFDALILARTYCGVTLYLKGPLVAMDVFIVVTHGDALLVFAGHLDGNRKIAQPLQRHHLAWLHTGLAQQPRQFLAPKSLNTVLGTQCDEGALGLVWLKTKRLLATFEDLACHAILGRLERLMDGGRHLLIR